MSVAEAVAGKAGADSPPDEELIRRICENGDEEAFQAVYDRYFRRVYQFVDKRLRNRADTEETVQEVFINLFSSLSSFRGEAPFAAWVFGLTRRTLANRFKKKRHVTVPLADEDGSDAAIAPQQRDADPHQAYEYRERLSRMEWLVDHELSEEQRALFLLHHLQHRSIQHIARTLGKSEDAVKSHLYRARKVLLAR